MNAMNDKMSYRIVDTPTPRYVMFSPRFKRSTAYKEVQEHLPVMITQIIDGLTRNKETIVQRYGEQSMNEIKTLIGNLAHLKYQLQTNKDFTEFTGVEPDKDVWNTFIRQLPVGSDSFFRTCLIYTQCYLYRKISSFFENIALLQDYDYYEKAKRINLETQHVLKLIKVMHSNLEHNDHNFHLMLKMSMWGKRCQILLDELDLDEIGNGQTLEFINRWNSQIICDESSFIWYCLTEYIEKKPPFMVDIVCNEIGIELLIDLFLAEYLIEKKIASKVRFHLKAIPWFVMQATNRDMEWFLNHLESKNHRLISDRVQRWRNYFSNSQFVKAETQYFWTSPYEYYKMREVDPGLYKYLSKAQLIIFKGDLNYRKLVGDYYWESRDKFISCIRGFQPTNICSLRVMETDALCGLDNRKADELRNFNAKVMVSKRFGTIQFAECNECGCGLD